MGEPTIEETSRLMWRLNAAGTVKRIDLLHGALCAAYETGRADEAREQEYDRAR